MDNRAKLITGVFIRGKRAKILVVAVIGVTLLFVQSNGATRQTDAVWRLPPPAHLTLDAERSG